MQLKRGIIFFLTISLKTCWNLAAGPSRHEAASKNNCAIISFGCNSSSDHQAPHPSRPSQVAARISAATYIQFEAASRWAAAGLPLA